MRTYRQDEISTSLMTIDSVHHEIHEGEMFAVNDYMDVSAATQDFLMVTGSKYPHMIWEFEFEGEFQVDIYEGATTSSDGTPLASYNRNRNSTNVATAVMYTGPTVTGTGTKIAGVTSGSGKSSGGSDRQTNERILKPNTKYLYRFTKVGVGTLWMDWKWLWYEESTN